MVNSSHCYVAVIDSSHMLFFRSQIIGALITIRTSRWAHNGFCCQNALQICEQVDLISV